jgi:Tfp pilus assembly protein PilF
MPSGVIPKRSGSSPIMRHAHYNLANTLANQGQLDLAAQHYQSAFAHRTPRSADAHNNLAYILRRPTETG